MFKKKKKRLCKSRTEIAGWQAGAGPPWQGKEDMGGREGSRGHPSMLCSSTEVWWEGAAEVAQEQHGRRLSATRDYLCPCVGKRGQALGENVGRRVGREADERLVATQAAF